jgi:hypothetical protein
VKAFIIILCFLIASCGEETKQEFNKEVVALEMRQMMVDYHSAINKNGLLAEFDYLDSSAQFFWIPPGYTSALSYDSVRTIITANAKALRSVDFKWSTLEVIPLSGNIGTYQGIVKGKTVDTSNSSLEFSILESGTLIKRNEGWKLLSGQSAILPDTLDH